MYLHACYWVGGMLPGQHYERLIHFVVYFVLKMFKNIDFYIKTRCTQGVRVFFFQSKNVISDCMTKSSVITGKLCKVHMRVFKLLLIAILITEQNN